MPPIKAPKRTDGFTTIDKEVHDLLDKVRPVAERVYRKLHQRVNTKRGDYKVYPDWNTIMSDTGIKNRTTLNYALKELEQVGLVKITRGYNHELRRQNVNVYYIVPGYELKHSTKIVPDQVRKSYSTRYENRTPPGIKIETVTKKNITKKKVTKKNGTRGTKRSPSRSPRLSPGADNQHEKSQYENRTQVKGKLGILPFTAADVQRAMEEARAKKGA